MALTPLNSPLLFEGLIDHLRRLGFSIGLDHQLRLEQLLSYICGECSPQDLKWLICPLFAVNEKQQDAFYSAFDSLLPLLSLQTSEPAISTTTGPARHREAVRRLTPARWPYFPAAFALLALLIGLAEWKSRMDVSRAPPTAQADSPTMPTAPEVTDRTFASGQAPPKAPTSGSGPENPTTAQPQTKGQRSAKLSVFEWVARQAARFPFDRTTVIVVFGPILFFLGYEVYRFRCRRLVLQKQASRKPPHSWPIRVKSRGGLVYDSPQFSVAARRLHSRQVAESYHLDLKGSVLATSGSLGYPSLQYRPDTRLSEYLVLIDNTSAHDHQAALFTEFTNALHGQGVYVQQYFFDGDPRFCWSPEANTPIRLSDLQSQYGGHRLLLIGDADRLTDPVTGRLEGWAHAFSAWSDRAILTPLPVSSWGARERTLAGEFIVLPATTEALSSLVGFFSGSYPSETLRGPICFALDGGWDVSPSDLVARMQIDLGPDLFSWLCASAIYPELQWDLTLYLASLPCMPADLVTEANLLRLIALPWFRTGVIPDEIRFELIRQLSPPQERAVRHAIVELLEQNPADEDTFAFETQALEIAVNHYLLSKSKKQRGATRQLRQLLSTNGAVGDHVVVRSVEPVQSSPLDFLLPRELRCILYERGLAVLGLRTAVRFALAIAVVAIGVGAISSWRLIQIAYRKPERLPLPAVPEYAVSLESNVPDARYLIDGNVPPSLSLSLPPGAYTVKHWPSMSEIGSTRPLRLPVGEHTVQAFLPGYKPVTKTFTLLPAVAKPYVISFQLEPEPVRLRLASNLISGKVSLDGQLPVDLQDGNFMNEGISLSADHTFSLIQAGNESLVFSFRAEPGGMVTISPPIKAKDISAVMISNFVGRARVYASDSSLKAGVKDQTPQPIPADGLDFDGVTAYTEIRLDDGKSQQSYPVELGNAPTLAIWLTSDPNQATLVTEVRMPVAEMSLDGRKPRPLSPGMNYLVVETGRHTFRLSRQGYEPVELTLELKKGETRRLPISELKPLVRTASLLIEDATRGAEVLIDSDSTPRGIVTADGSFGLGGLTPYAHLITLRKGDFEEKQLLRRFAAGETLRISGAEAQLTPYGSLQFRVMPAGSIITYRRLEEPQTHTGENGKTVSIQAGHYLVAVADNGFGTRSETVTVEPGRARLIDWLLTATVATSSAPLSAPYEIGDWGPSIWSGENGWFLRKVAGPVLFPQTVGKGVIQFSVRWEGGSRLGLGKGHVQWVLNYVDAKNYLLCELEETSFQIETVTQGQKPKSITKKISIRKQMNYTIRITLKPDGITHELMDGSNASKMRAAIPIGPVAGGKFGFLIPGGQTLFLANFGYLPAR